MAKKKTAPRAELIQYYRGRLAQIDSVLVTLNSERAGIVMQIKQLTKLSRAQLNEDQMRWLKSTHRSHGNAK